MCLGDAPRTSSCRRDSHQRRPNKGTVFESAPSSFTFLFGIKRTEILLSSNGACFHQHELYSTVQQTGTTHSITPVSVTKEAMRLMALPVVASISCAIRLKRSSPLYIRLVGTAGSKASSRSRVFRLWYPFICSLTRFEPGGKGSHETNGIVARAWQHLSFAMIFILFPFTGNLFIPSRKSIELQPPLLISTVVL